jgi:acetyl-CoA decarbonylase/synthase complex subunit epsilon
MIMPYHKVNVPTGTRTARIIEDGAQYAVLIKKAQRPLLIVGPRCLTEALDEKPLLDWALAISRTAGIPICATAHTKKGFLERGYSPESSYDVVEILNSLKNPNWKGVRGEGNHDLVIFLGIRTDLASAGLSTLKHYAPHLKTMTLCRYYFPNADYSMPNFPKEKKWLEFLNAMIDNLAQNQEGERDNV